MKQQLDPLIVARHGVEVAEAQRKAGVGCDLFMKQMNAKDARIARLNAALAAAVEMRALAKMFMERSANTAEFIEAHKLIAAFDALYSATKEEG